jgi:hypothetical protein
VTRAGSLIRIRARPGALVRVTAPPCAWTILNRVVNQRCRGGQLPQMELKVTQLRPTDAADLHFQALPLVIHSLGASLTR